MFNWLEGRLKAAIEETVNGWIEEILEWILGLMSELVFNIPESTFANNVMSFLAWFTSVFAIVIALYKVIEYMINTQNGTQEYPLDEILLRVVKSAGAMLVLPWVLKIIMLDIALPISNYFVIVGTDLGGTGGYVAIILTLSSRFSQGVVLILMLLFFLIVFLMFMYSVCVFYADYIIMQIMIAPVSLSMIADDNNFFQVWWRELLSEVTSILVKLFLMTLILNLLFSGGSIYLAVGAGALIIKTPSVLKNMWYGGGGARAMSRGAGAGARMLLSKVMK